MLLIKPTVFNISIDSSSLNIFSSLLPHLSQITERNNFLSKICYILGFLNCLYLLELMQKTFFILTVLESIHKINLWFRKQIILSFFSYVFGENELM